MGNTLKSGDVRVGHIQGPDSGDHLQAATLTYGEGGALLRIPYVRQLDEEGQFAQANRWFHSLDSSAVPSTLVFSDTEGVVTLSGLRFAGNTDSATSEGRLRARSVIFNAPRTFQDEYRVRELHSTIDGLEEFAGFSPVRLSWEEGNRNRVTAIVEPDERVEWIANDFTYAIESNVPWQGQDGRHFEVMNAAPLLTTTKEGGATVSEHLRAQHPVRALLLLAHGRPLYWRRHSIKDDEFPTWMMAGPPIAAGRVDIQVAQTVQEHELEGTPRPQLSTPSVALSDLGAARLARWVDLYEEDGIRRAVQPAVEVLNGATKFLEPQMMMLAIAMERFGHYSDDARRRRLHEYIERCMEDADLDWPQIGRRTGIARALADLNNDLKHADRPNYPETDVLVAMVGLAKIIVRSQLFHLLDISPAAREPFFTWGDAANAVRTFERLDIRIGDDGSILAH